MNVMSAKDAVGSIPGYTWHLLQNFFYQKACQFVRFPHKNDCKASLETPVTLIGYAGTCFQD